MKSRSNQPMLPNRHSSVHTWKGRANHLSWSHPGPPQPGPPQHRSDKDRATKATPFLLLFTHQRVFMSFNSFPGFPNLSILHPETLFFPLRKRESSLFCQNGVLTNV